MIHQNVYANRSLLGDSKMMTSVQNPQKVK